MAQIVYASEKYFESFHQALDQVAREKIYIEMIEAKPLAKVIEFQSQLIEKNWPVYYAIDNNQVVGWADIVPAENPRLAHRGFLGMGVLKSFRNQGLGGLLLKSNLDHAKKIGLEKVELSVYTTNTSAIHLYRKFNFEEIGVVRKYRKVDGQYFDCLMMEKFL